jgi:cell wall-associated NlpC family hydrolase
MIGTLALAAAAGACASTGAVPKPFPTPGSTAPPSARTDDTSSPAGGTVRAPFDGYAVAGTALGLRGTPYRNGGSDMQGFDCSGFTQYVFAQHGIRLPRDVRDQFRVGKAVDSTSVAPGDLVFFTTTDPGVSHVAIALGGDQFVHAPSSSGVVRVERFSSSYWAPRYVGARRVSD